MSPLAASRLSPPGNPAADHVYGGTPPVAVKRNRYGVFAAVEGRPVVVIWSDPVMVSGKTATAVCWRKSVTVTVTLNVPPTVGVPAMSPVAAFTLRPEGNPA